jgi:intergrase/recombinase
LLEKHAGAWRDRGKVSDYARKHNLLRPKYIRKLNWRVLEAVITREAAAKFIQSRFSELEISKAVYSDLLAQADYWYPKAMEALKRGLGDTEYLRTLIKPGAAKTATA